MRKLLVSAVATAGLTLAAAAAAAQVLPPAAPQLDGGGADAGTGETEAATTSDPTPFGTLLRRHRFAAGLTQEVLAERAGVSARAVSDLERGGGRRPRLATVALLAAALGLAPAPRAALLAAARPGADAARAPSTRAPTSTLPVYLTSFVVYLEVAERATLAAVALPRALAYPALRAKAFYAAAALAQMQADLRTARTHFALSLEAFRGLGDVRYAAGSVLGFRSLACRS